jgi:hypothetical protein
MLVRLRWRERTNFSVEEMGEDLKEEMQKMIDPAPPGL